MAKYQAEITIRGVRKLSRSQQKKIGQWIKTRGQAFKKENVMKMANTFSYRLIYKATV